VAVLPIHSVAQSAASVLRPLFTLSPNYQYIDSGVVGLIGGHNPPGHNPLGQNLPVSGKAGRNRAYSKENFGLHIYGERGARAYNGGLGAEPQRGQGQSSPEADSILAFERKKKAANLPLCLYFAMSVHY